MNKISISLSKTKKSRSIELFFKKVFTQSEDKKEGKIVSKLSFKLAKLIDGENVIGIEAKIKTKIVGYIFLTKLQYKENYLVYLLAPVAVDNKFQKQGIGQKIIQFALKYLKKQKVDLLMTYGDPRYYRKSEFKKTNIAIIPAPYKLSQPIGWLVNKISLKKLKIKSKPKCVLPFRNKKLW
jgi:putative acetyltransferase